MTVFKSGNLVVLKSGGPIMTVDAVHTDIFDDSKLTGVVCVWFLGEELQRVRFEPDAIEHARLQKTSSRKPKAHLEEATGEYKAALDICAHGIEITFEEDRQRRHPRDRSGERPRQRRRAAKRHRFR